MFIKLTHLIGEEKFPIWINPKYIKSMGYNGVGGAWLDIDLPSGDISVAETPEHILELAGFKIPYQGDKK